MAGNVCPAVRSTGLYKPTFQKNRNLGQFSRMGFYSGVLPCGSDLRFCRDSIANLLQISQNTAQISWLHGLAGPGEWGALGCIVHYNQQVDAAHLLQMVPHGCKVGPRAPRPSTLRNWGGQCKGTGFLDPGRHPADRFLSFSAFSNY